MKTATIVILTKNAEAYLPETLEAIFHQKVDYGFEVIAVDSGSKDRSLEILASYPVRVMCIPPETFNHGGTRNLGAQEADPESKYIVFLSQDAAPYDENWLGSLLAPFEENPQVAGVFSRHLPRPGSSAATVRQLTVLTQTGGQLRLVKKMPASLEEYEAEKFFYIFFSNTSSAVRKVVWEKMPFDQVDFAEDAVWADRVLRGGYTIVFEPSSMVLHSHNYNAIEQFRQNVDHAHAMYRLFRPPSFRDEKLWLKHLLRIPIEVRQDYRTVRTSPFLVCEPKSFKIRTILYSPAWHLATVLGGWVGAHLEDMPPALKRILSRQERIKQS
jgi:rhamnosyltransferase